MNHIKDVFCLLASIALVTTAVLVATFLIVVMLDWFGVIG